MSAENDVHKCIGMNISEKFYVICKPHQGATIEVTLNSQGAK